MEPVDHRSGRRYAFDPRRWRGDDGAPLAVAPAPGLTPDDVETRTRSVWRYRRALAGGVVAPVSLGEGCTPLLETAWGGQQVSFKLEWSNPTGGFRDRGTTVMVSGLAQAGVTEVIEDSSGNGGSSVAAYCARAGIAARILVPEGTSPSKVLQARAHGAQVVVVPGDRRATAERAVQEAGRTTYASHNWHPLFLEGVKSLAYELWEDLGFQAPDAVVTVAGSAASSSAWTRASPSCSPPAGSTGRPGCWSPSPPAAPPSTPRSRAVPRAASVRPSRRAPRSGSHVLASRGAIRPGERTVVVLTGCGLKAAAAMGQVFA